MTHAELVALIRGGVDSTGGTWTDFGAGRGNFTAALCDLLGSAAKVYAVDKSWRDLDHLRARLPDVQTITADFTQPLDLPPLDGILMANALHWNRHQVALLRQISGYLRPGGRLLIVEYDVGLPRGYIPFPVSYSRFSQMSAEIGLTNVQKVGERASPSSGVVMYVAVAMTASDEIT